MADNRPAFRVIPYEEWKETLDSIIEVQERNIQLFMEKLSIVEKEHPKPLVPYVKQHIMDKLVKEYTSYVENLLMRESAEINKDKYVYAITESGLPMLLNKKTYEMSVKYFQKEGNVKDLYF